jgi:hypothetical protein
MGRKPKLTKHQAEEARGRIAKGESTRDADSWTARLGKNPS